MTFFVAFLAGLFSGLLCVAGISLGTKLLLDSVGTEETSRGAKNKRKIFLGVAVFLLQFVLAALVLYVTGDVRQKPLAAGLGVLLSIGGFSLLLLQKKQK